ncbi:hypothetical protein [Bradyrhizobium sp.]|uniref:hypothetical protein n=1 Tax=Bradyrhizobium sp. TaxID=376 RepID=UPI002DFEBC14|nr:hypothetical protein [Bradyrhizobium sp.]
MTDNDTVLVERDGPIIIVSINRPHCRNAEDDAIANELRGGLEVIASGETLSAPRALRQVWGGMARSGEMFREGSTCPVSRTRCGVLHAAPQSRDRTKRRRLLRPRLSSAPRREGRRAAQHPGNARSPPSSRI